MLLSFLAGAQDVKDTTVVEVKGKKYYRYVVAKGNTIYSVSRLYGVHHETIKAANPWASDGLNIGDTLLVPALDKDINAIKQQIETDGNVIVHEVEKGQTLYAISRMYNLKVKDLVNENPELSDGVKVGQLIRIPIHKIKKEVEVEELMLPDDKHLVHEVAPQETLYSLSKQYGVSMDSIKAANSGLPEGLKVDTKIWIPRKQVVVVDTTAVEPELKEEYNVALFLPFYLDLNDTLKSKLKVTDKDRILKRSVAALEFYQGVRMAFDSLEQQGFKANLYVYDTAKDTAKVREYLNQPEMKEMDLIIGPLYYSGFKYVAAFAKANKIHIVSPVAQSNKVLLGNPYVCKVATSKTVQMKMLADYFHTYYRTENIVTVTKLFRINNKAKVFVDEYRRILDQSSDTNVYTPVREVKWSTGDVDDIDKVLSDSGYNVILVPSDDRPYITELLTQLDRLSRDHQIIVVGQESWLKYTNIDFRYLHDLHALIPVDGYLNYEHEGTKAFSQRYIKRYESFPERFAFLGFETAYYFGGMLKKYGTGFASKLEQNKVSHNYTSFGFFKTGVESGYENRNLVLLKFHEFELLPVYSSAPGVMGKSK